MILPTDKLKHAATGAVVAAIVMLLNGSWWRMAEAIALLHLGRESKTLMDARAADRLTSAIALDSIADTIAGLLGGALMSIILTLTKLVKPTTKTNPTENKVEHRCAKCSPKENA
ncbi:MAG: hypothetical protein K8R90_05165 [Candidatus Cloacimonetes bacterium]|nr:hypothetical protein [Candidatus Cloacimonadota bacterium]